MESKYQLKELKIEVTYKCALACIHCSSDATPSNTLDMNPDKCMEIIKHAAKLGVIKLAFSGGEPLLWPSLEYAIELASSFGIEVTVYTTGNAPNIEEILLKLRDKGLKRAIFSVFGPNSQTHERITRISGSFQQTINAIKIAQKLLLETEIHFVALVRNYYLLKGVAELGNDLGVHRVSVLRFVPQGRGSLLQNDTLNINQNIELKRSIEELRRLGYNIRTGTPFNVLLLNDNPKCPSGKDRLIIAPDLRLYPCDAFKQIRAEDVVDCINYSSLENSTLLECWIKSPYLETIRSFLGSGFQEPCLSCVNVNKCLSGCLAQKVLAYGGLINKPDPACLMKKYNLF